MAKNSKTKRTIVTFSTHDDLANSAVRCYPLKANIAFAATSGALTLLTNCVMTWNTQLLKRAVERESQRTAWRYSIDALRSIGPVGRRHIDFRGTYRFPVERYADRLVASVA